MRDVIPDEDVFLISDTSRSTFHIHKTGKKRTIRLRMRLKTSVHPGLVGRTRGLQCCQDVQMVVFLDGWVIVAS